MSSSSSSITTKAMESVVWKLLQNFGTTLMSFFLQIWLARLLLPSDYGLIALTNVFITLSMIIIQTGFTSALIQKSSIDEHEIYSIHYASIVIAIVLYAIVFAIAPLVSRFYAEPVLANVLRVQGLVIPIASLYSVPMSIIQRNLQFKTIFSAGIGGMIGQGVVGITLAVKGFGVWALVYGSVTNSIITCMLVILLSNWKPKRQFSMGPVRKLLPFSSKILAINLLNTLSSNLKPLITGRVYSPELLGYYNRGYQFPSLLMINIDGAITSIAFPLLSRFQDDYNILADKLKKSLQASLYLVWPAMIGLMVVADPLITLLLTERWLPSVPFLQLTALECMLWPFSIFVHATNAIGKSGLSLRLNILAKVFDVLVMMISIRYGIYVFIASTFLSSLVTTSIIIVIVSRIIGLSLKDLLSAIMPILMVSLMMGALSYWVGSFIASPLAKLIIQVLVGGGVYLLVTWVIKFPSFLLVLSFIKEKFLPKTQIDKN